MDLSTVRNEIHDVRTKWCDIGLELKVPHPTLKSIETKYSDSTDCLREVLFEWIKAGDHATWQSLIDALKTRVIDEPRLAAELEAKYCLHTESQGKKRKQQNGYEIIQNESQEESKQKRPKLESEMCLIKQLQQELEEKDKQLEEKDKQLLEKNQIIQEKDDIIKAQDHPVELPKGIRGSAAVKGNIAYFRIGGDPFVYAYDSSNDKWLCIYPECPCIRFGLAVINGLLITIGGQRDGKVIGSLLSLTGEGTNKKWSDKFPPMPTKRLFPGIVRHQTMLIVAGGSSSGLDGDSLTNVEIMDTETRIWTTVKELPHPFVDAWLTSCGDKVFMLGGNLRKTASKSVLTCSPKELYDPSGKWDAVANVPVYNATCATVCGQLLAVGGKQSLDKPEENSSAIYAYNPTENTWSIKCGMKTARSFCLVAALPNNKLMAVGGFIQGPDKYDEATSNFEFQTLKLS